MPDLQRIVSVLPDGTLNHNVLRNAVLLLGAAIEARGLEHVTLDATASDFQREILRYAAEPGTAVYMGHRYYDLGLTYSKNTGDVRRNLFEVLDRPVFAMLQDHPFTRFMWARMQGASPTTHFVAPTPEFQAEAQFINPRLRHFHRVSAVATEPEVPAQDIRPLAERSIDLFMPCGMHSTTPSLEKLRKRYADAGSPMTKVIDEVYAIGLTERNRSMLALFRESVQQHFGKPLVLATPLSVANQAVLLVLSCIDLRIRLDRRLRVLRSLARLDPGLRIVVTANPAYRSRLSELKGRPNIELVGDVTAARARDIFLDSRFAINVTPTYVACVTERVSNAMGFGCCVISDRNRHLAETFGAAPEILFMDDRDLDRLQPYFREDLDQAQAIATRARDRVRRDFAVPKLADDLIAVMRAAL